MAMPQPEPRQDQPPGAGGAAGSTDPTQARIARLRGREYYERTASPAEIEADLGALRALDAMVRPYHSAVLGVGLATFVGFLVLSIALVSAIPRTPAAFFVPAVLGVVLTVVVFMQGGRLRSLDRKKLEVASSLVRRLDVAPGGEVMLGLGLRIGEGFLVKDQKVASSFWQGTASFSRAYEDPWLRLEAPLSSGARVQMARTSMKFELVSTKSAGNRTTITTRTSRAFHDVIAVRYDPAQNPGLAAAGAEPAKALRLAQDARVTAFDNQPGALGVTVDTGPRADGTNVPGELASTIAAVVHLAAPARYVVKVDGEAWAPDLGAEAEATRQGVSGTLRNLKGSTASLGPTAMMAGGGLVIAFALLLTVGAVSLFLGAATAGDNGDRAQGYLTRAKANLAKSKSKADKDQYQQQVDNAKADVGRAQDEAQDKVIKGIVQLVAGVGLLAGGAAIVVVGRRKRQTAETA
jgi:hypothetical protein